MGLGSAGGGAAAARAPLPVPPPIPLVAPVQPLDQAIVLGIDHYLPDIPKLQGAINDCHLFTRWLVDPNGGGLDPANIIFYSSIDPTDQVPRLDQIQNLLIDALTKRVTTGRSVGRRLYLFMSGHGVSVPEHPDDCALVAGNGHPLYLRALIGAETAATVRRAGLFDEVMLVMDCCREVSGRVFAELGLPKNDDPTLGKKPFFHVLAASWGATAAERLLPDPLDPKLPASRHGVLTHALLVALRTAGDDHGDVTAASLKPAIRRGVRELLGAADPRLPDIRYEEDLDPMWFGRAQGIELVVRLLPGTTRVELRHGTGFTPVPLPAASPDGAFRLRLAPGIYLIEGFDAAGARTTSLTQTLVQEAADVAV
jgi:Caspase domain